MYDETINFVSAESGEPVDSLARVDHLPRVGEYVWLDDGKYRVEDVIHAPREGPRRTLRVAPVSADEPVVDAAANRG